MPVRLLRPYGGQAVNTLFWAPFATEDMLKATSNADDRVELASDYAPQTRIATGAAVNTSFNASIYKMNSPTAQTLTVNASGYWPAGYVLTVEQLGAGATTVVGASGITVNPGQGLASLVTKGQRAVGQLIKELDGSWTAIGGFGG